MNYEIIRVDGCDPLDQSEPSVVTLSTNQKPDMSCTRNVLVVVSAIVCKSQWHLNVFCCLCFGYSLMSLSLSRARMCRNLNTKYEKYETIRIMSITIFILWEWWSCSCLDRNILNNLILIWGNQDASQCSVRWEETSWPFFVSINCIMTSRLKILMQPSRSRLKTKWIQWIIKEKTFHYHALSGSFKIFSLLPFMEILVEEWARGWLFKFGSLFH